MSNQHRYPLFIMSIFAMLIGGFSMNANSQVSSVPSTPIIKVAVFADDRITADGAPITIDALRNSFKKLAEQQGAVWYYREAGTWRTSAASYTGDPGDRRGAFANQTIESPRLFGLSWARWKTQFAIARN